MLVEHHAPRTTHNDSWCVVHGGGGEGEVVVELGDRGAVGRSTELGQPAHGGLDIFSCC